MSTATWQLHRAGSAHLGAEGDGARPAGSMLARGCRQPNRDRGAFPLVGNKVQTPTMIGDNASGNRQAKPGSRHRCPDRVRSPEKPVEQVLLIILRDADSGIYHLDYRGFLTII